MTGAVRETDVARFRAVIASRLGLQFDERQGDLLTLVLTRRSRDTKQEVAAYLSGLERGLSPDELRALPPALTVAETYFFRHRDQFRALTEVVIPERLAARRGTKQLRIVSLGCASGEEAYSLAIAAAGAVADPACEVSLLGVDMNADLIARARAGRFSRWSLRDATDEERATWFRAEGRDFVLDERIRARVRFDVRNLIDLDATLWGDASYDVVFCRNVLMYFAPDRARALVDRLGRALSPGGYLFLGHAETLRGLSTAFELCHTHNTFYYRRPHVPSGAAAGNGLAPPTAAAAGPEDTADPGAWVDVIQRACTKLVAMAEPAPADPREHAASPAVTVPDLAEVHALIGHERFEEALAEIERLPAAVREGTRVQVIRAAVEVYRGRHEAGAAICERLLAGDEPNAGARFVLGLCRSAAGDDVAAAREYAMAAHLEPGFAMPRLHRGLLASRAGDARTARRELAAALLLLDHEHEWRIQMFGGGFSREALVRLCRAALARVEATAR